MQPIPLHPADSEESHLAPLDSLLLRAIAQTGQVKRFSSRVMMVGEGASGDSLYIILSGRVKAFSVSSAGKEVVFNVLGVGEYFGELALDGNVWSSSVMTLEPTTVSVVPADSFRRFVAQHPDFALNLIFKLIHTVRDATENIKGLALQDVYGRVLSLLMSNAMHVAGRDVVLERLTQQDIAHRVGSSREMVSRVFKELTRDGYITLEDRRIVILKRPPDAA